MILTCNECHTQYEVDDDVIDPQGQDVRCTSCGHVWFQMPAHAAPASFEIGGGRAAEIHAPSFAEVMAAEVQAAALAEDAAPVQADDDTPVADALDESMMHIVGPAGAAETEEDEEDAAEAVSVTIPLEMDVLPVTTHRPFGVEAGRFGLLVFLLLFFATALVLLAARTPISRHYPQMGALYALAGMQAQPPGAGLRFSELNAETKIDKDKRTLDVVLRVANMTQQDVALPGVTVTLKDDSGAVVKSWRYKPSFDIVEAGKTLPLEMSFADAPAGGKSIAVKVSGK